MTMCTPIFLTTQCFWWISQSITTQYNHWSQWIFYLSAYEVDCDIEKKNFGLYMCMDPLYVCTPLHCLKTPIRPATLKTSSSILQFPGTIKWNNRIGGSHQGQLYVKVFEPDAFYAKEGKYSSKWKKNRNELQKQKTRIVVIQISNLR